MKRTRRIRVPAKRGRRLTEQRRANHAKRCFSKSRFWILPSGRSDRQTLPDSVRSVPSDAIRLRGTVGEQPLAISVLLRQEGRPSALPSVRRSFGHPSEHLRAVLAFFERFGLRVTRHHRNSGTLELLGTAHDFEKAFRTKLSLFDSPYGKYRSYEGELFVPKPLVSAVRGVFGLDNRPLSRPLHIATEPPTAQRPLPSIEYVVDRYRFPTAFTGKGECIGVLAFGGRVSNSDLLRFFQRETYPIPELRFEYLTAHNAPNLHSRHDLETALDLQLAGGLAPGSRIVAYFSSNDERGWVNALLHVIHDKHRPTILSISWGATEDWWPTSTMKTLNRVLEEAALSGVTICAASGDNGSAKDLHGHCRVNFPASSPFVLSCGGTTVQTDGTEVVWNVKNEAASGGGVSDRIPRPPWQPPLANVLHLPFPSRRDPNFDGRQIPDVACLASRSYSVYAGGRYRNGIGGTSAVAPLWSALLARVNEGMRYSGKPRVGFLSPLLYRDCSLQQSFHNITSGHNDPFGANGYRAHEGWNACTGWGTPDGQRLLEALLQSN